MVAICWITWRSKEGVKLRWQAGRNWGNSCKLKRPSIILNISKSSYSPIHRFIDHCTSSFRCMLSFTTRATSLFRYDYHPVYEPCASLYKYRVENCEARNILLFNQHSQWHFSSLCHAPTCTTLRLLTYWELSTTIFWSGIKFTWYIMGMIYVQWGSEHNRCIVSVRPFNVVTLERLLYYRSSVSNHDA